jgi:hypothetical protein
MEVYVTYDDLISAVVIEIMPAFLCCHSSCYYDAHAKWQHAGAAGEGEAGCCR